MFSDSMFLYRMQDIFKKSILTAFNEIHNVVFFNTFLTYQLIEYVHDFLAYTYFDWKKNTQNAEFSSLQPRKFLNTEQKAECPSQTFTWHKLTLKQLPFPMTQISAFSPKN